MNCRCSDQSRLDLRSTVDRSTQGVPTLRLAAKTSALAGGRQGTIGITYRLLRANQRYVAGGVRN
jgi:hypothetical protein